MYNTPQVCLTSSVNCFFNDNPTLQCDKPPNETPPSDHDPMRLGMKVCVPPSSRALHFPFFLSSIYKYNGERRRGVSASV